MPRLTAWPGSGRNALVLLAFAIFFAQLFHAGNDLLVGRHEDPSTSPPGFGVLGSLAIVMIIGFGVLIGLVVGLGEQAEARRAGTAGVWRALVEHGPGGSPALQETIAKLPRSLPPMPAPRLSTLATLAGAIWIAGLFLDAVELYLLAEGTRSFLDALLGTFEGNWLVLRMAELPYAALWGVILARYEARQLGREGQAEAAASALDRSAVMVAVVRHGTLRYASTGLERRLGAKGLSGEPAELAGAARDFATGAEALDREEEPTPFKGRLELRLPGRGWGVQGEGVAVRIRFDGLPSTALMLSPD